LDLSELEVEISDCVRVLGEKRRDQKGSGNQREESSPEVSTILPIASRAPALAPRSGDCFLPIDLKIPPVLSGNNISTVSEEKKRRELEMTDLLHLNGPERSLGGLQL
jgi:hypothetical protein